MGRMKDIYTDIQERAFEDLAFGIKELVKKELAFGQFIEAVDIYEYCNDDLYESVIDAFLEYNELFGFNAQEYADDFIFTNEVEIINMLTDAIEKYRDYYL